MYDYLYHTYTANNPAGIVINHGYYALMEAIITGKPAGQILERWCGLKETEHAAQKSCNGKKTKKIVYYFRKYGTKIRNEEIAKRVGCTREMVSIVLRKMGVAKRNKWDNRRNKK